MKQAKATKHKEFYGEYGIITIDTPNDILSVSYNSFHILHRNYLWTMKGSDPMDGLDNMTYIWLYYHQEGL